MRRTILLAAFALLAVAPAAGAQSVISAGAFGVPVAPLDARARALGGVGVGLLGQNPALVNPAELSAFSLRGITVALQSSARSVELGGQQDRTGSNRFPMVGIVYPLGPRLTAGVGYGAFLDQSWAAFSEGTQIIGSDTVQVRDLIDADGGISQLQVGAAYALTPSLALGVAGGLYTGRLDRVVSRTFSGTLPGAADFRERFAWNQRAPFATVGLAWDPARVVRVGASVTWAGELEGDAEGRARDFTVDLPLQVAGGVSGLLAPRLTGAVSGRWAGWSAATNPFAPGDAPADTWEVGAGLEWQGPTMGDRDFPIRIGYHRARLPYPFHGGTPTEWAASLGFGARLAQTNVGPLAVLNAAVERGGSSVGSSNLTENFWRFTASLSVFGQ